MKRYQLWFLGFGAAVLGVGTFASQPALAQAAYGSYIGVGPAFGVAGGNDRDGRSASAVIAVRYKLLETPISLRTQAYVFGGTAAVVPTVSYDIPLNWQTDVYIGAGYSFSNGEEASPVGNRNGFAIQPGVDYVLPSGNTVIFGNAVIAFDAYRDGGGTAVSLQGGVGLRF